MSPPLLEIPLEIRLKILELLLVCSKPIRVDRQVLLDQSPVHGSTETFCALTKLSTRLCAVEDSV